MNDLLRLLKDKTSLQPSQIQNILKLMADGSTIPFIARYRKEMTGGATDEQLREFEDIYKSAKKMSDRLDEIINILTQKSLLDEKLKKTLHSVKTITELEDIYRPYKDKKNSRAQIAIDHGLESLANKLQSSRFSIDILNNEARKFIKGDFRSVNDVMGGIKDIIAERYSDSAKERENLRNLTLTHGILEVKATKKFNEKGQFTQYKDHSEKIAYIPSHRFLAISRGVNEKELSSKITIDVDRYFDTLYRYKIKKDAENSKEVLFEAYKDGFKRLLFPSIQREVNNLLKSKADKSAIDVFGKNIMQLFMTPPVTNKVMLGVDPAFRTGCKLAVIDQNGKYLDSAVIYPTEPRNDYKSSKNIVLSFVKKYNISGIAIGNGTASRETQAFFSKLNSELDTPLKYTVVSEAGASVYSASKIASLEYPDLDVTIRGAISIAQRVRDPMSTLVKIDPKSLGIGQYQHDVDQKLLEKKLYDSVESIVNKVGVDINSASQSLLSFVAGIGPKIAENIISYRDQNGLYISKSDLKKVKGLGAKAYEQSAGFIRIRQGKSIFDNSGIHPESYAVAKKFQSYKDISDMTKIASELGVGIETLKDIKEELAKPGFDPRLELPEIPFRDNLTDIKMLKEGSYISGVVRNIADFGAFIDIGLKNDGMIHISKMSENRISHPLEVLSINQYLQQLKVISVDLERGKVGLSLV